MQKHELYKTDNRNHVTIKKQNVTSVWFDIRLLSKSKLAKMKSVSSQTKTHYMWQFILYRTTSSPMYNGEIDVSVYKNAVLYIETNT